MSKFRRFSLGCLCRLIALAATLPLLAQATDIQTINLDAGWNLVAFQVIPSDSSPATVFGSLGNAFVRAWSFDNQSKVWTSYTNPNSAQTNDSSIALMPAVQIGKGYWIYMNQALVGWHVSGSAPSLTPGITLYSGWNMIGVPTGTGNLQQSVNMAAVMAASGMNYDVILKWELGQYKKFSGKDGVVSDFTAYDPAKGYWVNITTNTLTLQPRALSMVRPDINYEPTNNYPGPEDLALSPSRTPLDAASQTHVVFLPGEDIQRISLANRGGGILLWNLEWVPTDSPNVPWLTLSSTHGVTTIESDVITLGLNRKDLVQGIYRGVLTLHMTAGDRVFQVVANVPPLTGEWKGSATISSVNGRQNPVPDVDLFLSFFEDPSVPGLLRGAMDSQNAVLWPVDVPLIGHVESSTANLFTLGGGYVLPPGDQNNPPYDQFNPLAEDVDWNGNGQIDDLNPFPFPIYRSVNLIGQLVTASAAEGYTVTGKYLESVYGMLRQPIQLQGTFTLTRKSSQLFASHRAVLNAEASNPPQSVIFHGTNYPAGLLLSGNVVSRVTFQTDLVVQDIAVDVSIANAVPTNLTIVLIAPNGTAIRLHDHGDISATTFTQLRYPVPRPPLDPFASLLAAGVSSKGDWSLLISGSGGQLMNWDIKLQGQPVFSVAGRIVSSSTGSGLPAQVLLNGLPFSEVATADALGNFSFNRIPGIPVNFSANLGGFQPPDLSQPGLASSFTLPSFPTNNLSPAALALAAKFRPLPVLPFPSYFTDGFGNYGTATNPVQLTLEPRTDLGPELQVLASPSEGPGPLTVDFTVAPGTNSLPATAFTTWNFGDGAFTNGSGLFSVSHTYQTVSSNGYSAQFFALQGSAQVTVYVRPSPGNTPYSNNFFEAVFTGGGTLPTNYIDQIAASYPTNGPAQPVGLIMIQHADCASFDIDRAPKTTPSDRLFADDGFSTNGMIFFGTTPVAISADDHANGFHEEDSNYYLDPNIWQPWASAAVCGYVLDDNVFDPHPKPNTDATDCNGPRYRMLCNIGPQIVLPPNSEVFSAVALGATPLVPPVPDPLLNVGQEGIATVRELRLVTGPLAWSWNLIQE